MWWGRPTSAGAKQCRLAPSSTNQHQPENEQSTFALLNYCRQTEERRCTQRKNTHAECNALNSQLCSNYPLEGIKNHTEPRLHQARLLSWACVGHSGDRRQKGRPLLLPQEQQQQHQQRPPHAEAARGRVAAAPAAGTTNWAPDIEDYIGPRLR